MPTIEFVVIVLGAAMVAGLLGALLGLGGGIIIVPLLTLGLGVDIHYAIGASIVSVIATSSGAAIVYVRDRLTNLRIGMFLEIGTTTGAITGAFIAGRVGGPVLFLLFGVILVYSALVMLRKNDSHGPSSSAPDPLALSLGLRGEYYDPAIGRPLGYTASHSLLGLALMYVAGAVSGLLGIGSGILKVPAMDLAMHLPMKVSTATSNFMIGVTAAASAGIYFARGDVHPLVAAPVAIGVLAGATMGTRLLQHLPALLIRRIFVAVLLVVSAQMIMRGLSMVGYAPWR